MTIEKYFVDYDEDVLLPTGKLIKASALHNNRGCPYVSFQAVAEDAMWFKLGVRSSTDFNFAILSLIDKHNAESRDYPERRIHPKVVYDDSRDKKHFLIPPAEYDKFMSFILENKRLLLKSVATLDIQSADPLFQYRNLWSFLNKYSLGSEDFSRLCYSLDLESEEYIRLRLDGCDVENIAKKYQVTTTSVHRRLKSSFRILNSLSANPRNEWTRASVDIALKKLFRNKPESLNALMDNCCSDEKECARLLYIDHLTVRELIAISKRKNTKTIALIKYVKKILLEAAFNKNFIERTWVDHSSI